MSVLCIPVNKKHILFGRITNQAYGHNKYMPDSRWASGRVARTGECGLVVFKPGSPPRCSQIRKFVLC